MFEITFQYDRELGKWEVIAKGADSALDALQGFNAVLMTAREAILFISLKLQRSFVRSA